jgi:hypothetical protein
MKRSLLVIIAAMVLFVAPQAANAKKLPLSTAKVHAYSDEIDACDSFRKYMSHEFNKPAWCSGALGKDGIPCRYVIPTISRVRCHVEFNVQVRGQRHHFFCTNTFWYKWESPRIVMYRHGKWNCDFLSNAGTARLKAAIAKKRAAARAHMSTSMLRFFNKANADAHSKCLADQTYVHIDWVGLVVWRKCEGWWANCRRKPWVGQSGLPYNQENAYCTLDAFWSSPGPHHRERRRYVHYQNVGFVGIAIRAVKKGTGSWFNPLIT